MATSVIEICNNALIDLGEATITSLTDDSEPARLCNQVWPGVRDAVLREHPWNCCMTQARLAASAAAPLWKWDVAYTLPADFLRVVAVAAGDESVVTEWEVQGRTLLTDAVAPIFIAYVRREPDPTMYDPLLDAALAARMSAALAYPITTSTTLAQAKWTLYVNALAGARGVDAREGQTETVTAQSWLYAKLGGRSLDR
jgi:hypothetical protein